jgi:hypothetical protein
MFLVKFRLDETCGLVARGRKVSLDSELKNSLY